MKIQVMHDKTGKIHAVFSPTEGKRRVHLKSLDSNLTIVEVEGPEHLSALKAGQQSDIARAHASLMEDFVIQSERLVNRGKAQ